MPPTGSAARNARGIRSRIVKAVGRRLRFFIKLCLIAASSLVIAGHATSPAIARFTSQAAVDANTLSTRNLVAPASLSATPSGHDVQLNWPAGQNGNGYAVLGVANGTSSSCTGASFASLTSTASTSYTDSNRSTPQGTFFCYQVKTTYNTWTSQSGNPTAAAQLGFVATSVQLINDGNHTACSGSGAQLFGQAGTLDCGDQIIITFNQAVNTTTGPTATNTVCARRSNNTIWLASTTTTGNCTATETINLGKLTGGTIGVCDCRFNLSTAWSNGDKNLTVTIGARVAGSGYPTISTSVWTFTPTTTAAKMLSTTGGFHICDTNTGGGNCLPSTGSASTFSPVIGKRLRPGPHPRVTPTPTPKRKRLPPG
jgi:hypothetical protein